MKALGQTTSRVPQQTYSDNKDIWGVWETNRENALRKLATAAKVIQKDIKVWKVPVTCTSNGIALTRFMGRVHEGAPRIKRKGKAVEE